MPYDYERSVEFNGDAAKALELAKIVLTSAGLQVIPEEENKLRVKGNNTFLNIDEYPLKGIQHALIDIRANQIFFQAYSRIFPKAWPSFRMSVLFFVVVVAPLLVLRQLNPDSIAWNAVMIVIALVPFSWPINFFRRRDKYRKNFTMALKMLHENMVKASGHTTDSDWPEKSTNNKYRGRFNYSEIKVEFFGDTLKALNRISEEFMKQNILTQMVSDNRLDIINPLYKNDEIGASVLHKFSSGVIVATDSAITIKVRHAVTLRSMFETLRYYNLPSCQFLVLFFWLFSLLTGKYHSGDSWGFLVLVIVSWTVILFMCLFAIRAEDVDDFQWLIRCVIASVKEEAAP